MDKIFIQALQVDTIIGVWPHEKKTLQPLLFDIELAVNNQKVAYSDLLNDAVDYHAVTTRITELAQQNQFELLEPLAEKIASVLLDEFQISSIRLRINKPKALANAHAVGVEIFRERPV